MQSGLLLSSEIKGYNTMKETSQDRRATYEAKRIKKTVSFNADTDQDLLKIVASLPDFSGWVKEKLKELRQQ